ncbi:MAG TPA: DUF87 domain-containing protein [Thermoplasmata archaeon]|nr:DUF87 domain-containing protein [Thermoplasmata archaeon]
MRAIFRGPPLAPRYRFRPEGPAWDLPFLRRLAEGLAACPPGHAILVETSYRSDPWVVPGSPAMGPLIERAAEGIPGQLERIGRPVPTLGSIGPSIRFGILFPQAAAPGRGGELSGGPRSDLAAEEGLDAWLPGEPWPRGAEEGATGVAQWHWFATGGSELAVRVRYVVSAGDATAPAGFPIPPSGILRQLSRNGTTVAGVGFRPSRRRRRSWASGSLAALSAGAPFRLSPGDAARAVRPPRPTPALDDAVLQRHLAALGASGSGKSSFLAALARDRIARGLATIVLDVHGDLGPGIAAGLDPSARARLTAVDATRPVGEIPGIALFSSEEPDGRDREASHLVASLRHLAHEGSEVYWGHRLEQIFDVFVRLVEEENGGFSDLYEMLTDPARRDAARASTASPVAARFLDELPALLRRNPEYLQAAVARVQKVAHHPKLRNLLDAAERAIDLPGIFDQGGSIVFRIPSAQLGPSESRFAATLIVSRAYLAVAAAGSRPSGLRVLAILDEAQSVSPTLLSEILCEGRKFGFGAAMATQYAARLAPDALNAAEGAVGTHLVFHVPRSGAAAAGRWVGLEKATAERLLPALPPGIAVLDVALSAGPRGLVRTPPPTEDGGNAWQEVARRTSVDLGPGNSTEPTIAQRHAMEEAVLRALFVQETELRASDRAGILDRASGAGTGFDRVALAARLPGLIQRGWVEESADGLRLTAAGAGRLGVGQPTGAVREGDEHRLLLIEAMRIFARQGAWLEILPQGRFDTRLPDGWYRQLPRDLAKLAPGELLRETQNRAQRWVWRAFGGRNVHVEAEVSGAERAERIRRGLSKASRAGAAVVFLVADARRARKVREVLHRAAAHPPEAQVWTLPKVRPGARNRQRGQAP